MTSFTCLQFPLIPPKTGGNKYILCPCPNCGIALWRISKRINCFCRSCSNKIKHSGDSNGQYKHGATKTTEYRTWGSMKSRCYNKNTNYYKHYGGRGIIVCQRWLNSFENFLADMGIKPSPSHSIDRKDNNGNYEPANVRWATDTEQACNQRHPLRSHCRRGHELIQENTYINPKGQRTCRICKKAGRNKAQRVM